MLFPKFVYLFVVVGGFLFVCLFLFLFVLFLFCFVFFNENSNFSTVFVTKRKNSQFIFQFSEFSFFKDKIQDWEFPNFQLQIGLSSLRGVSNFWKSPIHYSFMINYWLLSSLSSHLSCFDAFPRTTTFAN